MLSTLPCRGEMRGLENVQSPCWQGGLWPPLRQHRRCCCSSGKRLRGSAESAARSRAGSAPAPLARLPVRSQAQSRSAGQAGRGRDDAPGRAQLGRVPRLCSAPGCGGAIAAAASVPAPAASLLALSVAVCYGASWGLPSLACCCRRCCCSASRCSVSQVRPLWDPACGSGSETPLRL